MAEGYHSAAASSASGQPSGTSISRSDTWSSNNSYHALPEGRWILDFHGNCPRCHHQHNAVQVKIKVSQDARKVSNVRCERCRKKWAAFGGANTTQISLLSAATTEPDAINEEIRDGIIRLVRRATTIDTLDNITEQGTSSDEDDAASNPRPMANEPSHLRHRDRATNPNSPSQQSQSQFSSQTQAATSTLPGGSGRLLGLARSARDRHFPGFRRDAFRRLVRGSTLSAQPTRRLRRNASHNRYLPNSATAIESSSPIHTNGLNNTRLQVGDSAAVASQDFAMPTTSQEATAYLTSLNTAELGAMQHRDRIAWGRAKYTHFRANRNRSQSAQELSSAVAAQPALADAVGIRNIQQQRDRLSDDVLEAGGAADALPEPRDSTGGYPSSISETILEDETASSRYRHSTSGFGHLSRRGIESIRPLSVQSGRRRSWHTARSLRMHPNSAEVTEHITDANVGLPNLTSSTRSSQASTINSDRYSTYVNPPASQNYGSPLVGDFMEDRLPPYRPSPLSMEQDSNRQMSS